MLNFNEKLCGKVESYTARYPHNHRKMLLKLMFWQLKACFFNKNFSNLPAFKDDKTHIAVFLMGGLGDLLHGVRYILALERYLGENSRIDIVCESKMINILPNFISGLAERKILDEKSIRYRYDIFISLIRFPEVKDVIFSRLNDNTRKYIDLLNKFKQEKRSLYKNDFMATCFAKNVGLFRWNQADIGNFLDISSVDYELRHTANISDLSSKYGLATKNFITVQTGQGECSKNIDNETRQWPIDYYNELVEKLKRSYPQIQIVQVGALFQNKIEKADIDLRGKTTMDELFCLLKHARLHISQEGGLPIMRHYLKGGPSVVLFGPTDKDFFGFPENINLTKRSCPFACEWLCPNWLKSCAVYGGQSKCMTDLTPDFVMESLEKSEVLNG